VTSLLYFFLKNLATFFVHRCHYHYRFLLLSLGCHPLQGVSPHLFLHIRPRFSTILCKFAHKIFFLRVSLPWRVSPGTIRPSPSDATGSAVLRVCSFQPLFFHFARFARIWYRIWGERLYCTEQLGRSRCAEPR